MSVPQRAGRVIQNDWMDRHPVLALVIAPWYGLAMAVLVVGPLAFFVATVFGLLLLGDAVGLYDFDSGLGSEAGGR